MGMVLCRVVVVVSMCAAPMLTYVYTASGGMCHTSMVLAHVSGYCVKTHRYAGQQSCCILQQAVIMKLYESALLAVLKLLTLLKQPAGGCSNANATTCKRANAAGHR